MVPVQAPRFGINFSNRTILVKFQSQESAVDTESTTFKGLSYRINRITNTPNDRCFTTNRIQGINVFFGIVTLAPYFCVLRVQIAENLNFEKRCGSPNIRREVSNGRISLPNTSSERERNFRNSNHQSLTQYSIILTTVL